MKIDDNFIFVAGEVSSFEIRPQIVDPPETAALAATEETGGSRERSPASFAVFADVINEKLIFFFSPSSFVHVSFLATR